MRRTATPLAGRLVLVTGASSGVGAATARQCATAGADVVLVARRQALLDEVAADVRAAGRRAWTYSADLRDLDAAAAVASWALADVGIPDAVVANAGHSIRRDVLASATRFDTYTRLTNLNYLGAVALYSGFLPAFADRSSGHLIGVTSQAARNPIPGWAAYVASKAALDAWLRSAEPELREHGIYTTIVELPLVDTPMIRPVHGNSPWAISAERGASWIVGALVRPRTQVGPLYGRPSAVITALAPAFSARLLWQFAKRMPVRKQP